MPVPEAFALQRQLALLVSLQDRLSSAELIAGVDLAIGREAALGRGAVVVWQRETGEVVESLAVEAPLPMPYVPGLLAFREGPVVEKALREMRSEPDLLLFDGQGIAHPRGLGIAAHLGVLLDRPTVGVGKTRLFGHAPEPGPNPGDRQPLLAPDGRQIGVFLRTRAGSKPVYVSPGNHVSPDNAADLVMSCLRGHRLPEPVFLADRLSKTPDG
jgi:deoxyribonuclease V